jgi:hypothetical protein
MVTLDFVEKSRKILLLSVVLPRPIGYNDPKLTLGENDFTILLQYSKPLPLDIPILPKY